MCYAGSLFSSALPSSLCIFVAFYLLITVTEFITEFSSLMYNSSEINISEIIK